MEENATTTAPNTSMEIMVEEVRVRNFRSHKNTTVKLTPLTLLVGANNAGKTSFLRALGVALNGDRRYVTKEDLFITTDPVATAATQIEIEVKIVPMGNSNEFSEKWSSDFGSDIRLDPSGREYLAFLTIIKFKSTNLDPEIERLIISNWEQGTTNINEKLTARLIHMPYHFIDAKRDMLDDLGAASSYFGRLVKQIQYDQADLSSIENALETINQDAVARSPVLKHLKEKLKELNQTIRSGGNGVEITPFPKRIRDMHKGLKVHFQDGGSDSFSIEYHGMGIRSWASLLSFKAFIDWETQLHKVGNEPFLPILALEEPEAHLHPNAQRQLYSQTRSICGQKIISTHSPYIAGKAGLDELVHFAKHGDNTQATRIPFSELSPEEARKLSLEIFNTRGEIIFAKLVVLFEGVTEEQSFPKFTKEFLGEDANEQGVCFVGCGGSNYKAFLMLCKSFGIDWILISDYDNSNVRTDVDAALVNAGVSAEEKNARAFLLGKPYEQALIDDGYLQQFKDALIEFEHPIIPNEKARLGIEKHFESKKNDILAQTEASFLQNLPNSRKAKISGIYTEKILALDPLNRIPVSLLPALTAIKNILDQ